MWNIITSCSWYCANLILNLSKMWIAHHKRILLWYTARNILAIFYMLQIGVESSCDTDFDNVQSRALLSQIVIAGRIDRLELTRAPTSRDYRSYTARVQVMAVIKQSKNPRNNEFIRRKQYITIEGFLTNSEQNSTTLSTMSTSAQSLTSSTNSSTKQHCLSYVSLSKEYILFINRSSSGSKDRTTYHTAQLSTNYTRTGKKRIKEVLCEDCAKAPNAKSKRNLQTKEGASNYKISCRVEGNPPPDVRWYKNGRQLDSSMRGIAVKHRRRRSLTIVTIRLKSVKPEHAGTYKCIAKNLLGHDTAKSRLKVLEKVKGPKPTPPPPGSDLWDSIEDGTTAKPVSHYIPCKGKDRNYCLHGGECKVYRDGRYRHCRCLARFKGARCQEANIIPPSAPIIQSPPSTISEQGMELVSVAIVIASVLAILVILLLIMAFYCAGWKFRGQRERRFERHLPYTSVYQPEDARVDETDSKFKQCQTVTKQCQTTASQTEPIECKSQHLRRSLNLENYFPRSSTDLVLRRKSPGHPVRPVSQPGDRRPTRSRLSATSTLTETRRENDSEFDVLPERTPSSASMELDISGSGSSCSDNPKPHANCDQECGEANSLEAFSLYISESTLDSGDDSNRHPIVRAEKPQRIVREPNDPRATDKYSPEITNNKYNLYNGSI